MQYTQQQHQQHYVSSDHLAVVSGHFGARNCLLAILLAPVADALRDLELLRSLCVPYLFTRPAHGHASARRSIVRNPALPVVDTPGTWRGHSLLGKDGEVAVLLLEALHGHDAHGWLLVYTSRQLHFEGGVILFK